MYIHIGRCLYDSGLTNKVLKSTEDFKVLDHRMGLMNMIQKPNIKSCQELTSEEIKEAQESLNKRIKYYRPKIVAFNGKTIFEIYTGSSLEKEFNFGKQPIRFANNTTDTFMYVMPSSSARCSQLPKVADKVPFYSALRKFRDYLCGYSSELSDSEIMFPDFKVALEVNANEETVTPNVNNSKLNKSKPDYMSDSEDNNSILDESHQPNSPATPLAGNGNNHKIKFVRLNNIPFSDLPADILENIKIQRKLKKNVTIITHTKDFFQKSTKKNVVNTLNSSKNHHRVNASSDLDTVTSDSSDYCTNSMSNEPATDKNFNLAQHQQQQQQLQQQQSNSSSRLTSLILNVCNSASGSNSNSSNTSISNISMNKSVSTIEITQPASPALMNRQHSVNSEHVRPVQSPLAASPMPPMAILSKPSSNSTIKQILSAPPSNHQNSQPQYRQIESNKVKLITPSNHQLKIQPGYKPDSQSIQQPKIIQMNGSTDLAKKIIIINTANGVTQHTGTAIPSSSIVSPPIYESNENDYMIDYELIMPNENNYGDYYTFETINQQASHFSSQEMKHDLNRVIKLYYGDHTSSDVDQMARNENNKRCFSTLNDANTYIQQNREFKRHCNVNFNKL